MPVNFFHTAIDIREEFIIFNPVVIYRIFHSFLPCLIPLQQIHSRVRTHGCAVALRFPPAGFPLTFVEMIYDMK